MRIVIPGGTGQVGAILARALRDAGDEVAIIGRTRADGIIPWDGRTYGEWASTIDGADVIINLAGRSVNCRYNDANRREIMGSRVHSTRMVGEAIARAARPPRVWLQASTATIYRHSFDTPNDESGPLGGNEPGAPSMWNFSIDVSKAWEAELDAADTPQTRKVAMRSAMTMSPDRDGIFDALLKLARRGLAGPAAGGRQYISWIHEHDFIESVRFIIARDDLAGSINLAAPEPLPNRDFMRELRAAWREACAAAGTPRRALGARVGLPATKAMIEFGAIFLRTESELVLKSRRVTPGRLLEAGFEFKYPHWLAAARELCTRWLAMNR